MTKFYELAGKLKKKKKKKRQLDALKLSHTQDSGRGPTIIKLEAPKLK